MKKGYYLWRWFDVPTIVFDTTMEMHCDDYAKTQDCFRRFDECKNKAIDDLEHEIEAMKDANPLVDKSRMPSSSRKN